MNIKQALQEDLKRSMLAKDKNGLTVIRGLMTAIKNQEIKMIRELEESEVVEVVRKAKNDTLDELNELLKAGGREERAAKLAHEVEMIKLYLPQMMDVNEVIVFVRNTIKGMKIAETPVNMGNVMKIVTPQLKGKAENKMISAVVTKELNKG